MIDGVVDTIVLQKEAPIDNLLREPFQKKYELHHQIQDDLDVVASLGQPIALLPCDE
ncbi:hypothetical protein D3C75_1107040 [compost metagenome]